MVSTSKRLAKRRKWKQAQDALRLAPNWHCGGLWVSHIPRRGHPTPPAGRGGLTRSVILAQPGKAGALPDGSAVARRANAAAGTGGATKRTLDCNGPDRA